MCTPVLLVPYVARLLPVDVKLVVDGHRQILLDSFSELIISRMIL